MTDKKSNQPNDDLIKKLGQSGSSTATATSSRAKDEKTMLAHEQKQFQNELGWLGIPFGGKKEKPGNISGLVIILCFIIIAIVYLNPPTKELGYTFGDIFATLMSIITLILGYLFGSNDRS